MSKIAVLSDIHGNRAALQAVLEKMARLKVAACFILGDFIGYYHRPLEVLQLLNDLPLRIDAIRGNHERMLERALQGELSWNEIGRRYGQGLKMAADQLPKESLDKLIGLPDQRLVECDGKRFLLCHGSPVDPNRYLYPDAEGEAFDFPGIDADYVLLGHTHYPMIKGAKYFCIVNPGSVGQAREQGGVADWCVINTDNDVITMQKTPYDIAPVVQDCEKYDPNIPYLQDVLRR